MKRILGIGVGLVYFVIAFAAFSRARSGWEAGHGDIGFWFTVVSVLLTVAALGAIIGTWIHTQGPRGSTH
jgi:hypothetical protein